MSVRALVRKVGFGVGAAAMLSAGTVAFTGASQGLAATEPVSVKPAAVTPVPAASAEFPDAAMSRNDQGDATVLRLDGIITPGTERRFLDTLKALPASRPLVVELSSPGGFTTAGYRMIDALLAERQAGRPVATRVRAGESCESMCVGLYLAGYPRYAAPTAEFMVHAPRMAESGRMTLRSTQAMVQRLVSLGASPTWIRQVTAAGGFSGALDYRETADRLTADGANIVTDLLY
ncbi:ATP-dependent Clp protease proteolytic subunit [Azospirillum picis]|uniref:ATP-dependent protease ClpP protease subunit n=1 Tax=Azospirillum picis TaxID=488438 RepID=A0ABU0MLX1_9PROT|nr:ATP-dependent Clp protease proteolytic subunit [Azospirillum picis]MBP2300492.1 ATP-dependent protease ClpP protease subunit [Azospirillum picis]MDQ0534461.1 ATP-dependent protease ClpP protease subunit [Azospirillum picis]